MRELILSAVIGLLMPIIGYAKPVAYQLNTAKSDVAFMYEFEGSEVKGSFPDFTTLVTLDFDQLNNSSIDVTLKTGTVKGGFVFATQALRGPKKCWIQTTFPRSNSNPADWRKTGIAPN
jgi:polyisoprenoid-binding protein YceI